MSVVLRKGPSYNFDEENPLSPVTAAVRLGSKSKPAFSLVHAPDFQIQMPMPEPQEGLLRRSAASYQRPASAATFDSNVKKMVIRSRLGRSSSKAEVRTLTQEEIEDQNQKAVEWFQNARAVNQRRISVDDMDYSITEVRRMRAEKAQKEAEEAAERAKKEAELLAKGERRLSRANSLKRPSTIGDGPALPALASNLKLGMLKGLKELAKDGDSASSENQEEPSKKGINLLEKFGYGVKANKFKAAVSAVNAANKFKKAAPQFVDIKVGGGDNLLERLQKRKEEKDAEKKAAAAAEKERAKAAFYRKNSFSK